MFVGLALFGVRCWVLGVAGHRFEKLLAGSAAPYTAAQSSQQGQHDGYDDAAIGELQHLQSIEVLVRFWEHQSCNISYLFCI